MNESIIKQIKADAEMMKSYGVGLVKRAQIRLREPSIILSGQRERDLMALVRDNHLDCKEVAEHIKAIYNI